MSAFPKALKSWREERRFSQLALALEADVSARHVSFLETGRARPSVQMIQRLSDALKLPLAARNQLLQMAGFAARYPGRGWDEAEMAPITNAIDHVLAGHAPYPGIAVDRLWRVLRMNGPAAALFAQMGVAEGGSLLDLVTSDKLPEMIENWPEVARRTRQRLRTESAAQGGVPELDAAVALLSAVPAQEGAVDRPVVPTVYVAGDLRLSLFSTIAQFGTPEDLTLEGVRIELFFPMDAATKAFFEAG